MEIKDINSVSRRRFIRSAGFFMTASALLPQRLIGRSADDEGQEGSIFKCKPYVLAASAQDITVAWVTRTPCHCWVHYGENPAALTAKTRQVNDGMAHVGTVHRATLTGLAPGQTYHYQIVAEEVDHIERKGTTFVTKEETDVFAIDSAPLSPEEVSFVVFNDIHERPESFKLLMQLSTVDKPAFIALNGDMVSSMRSEDHLITNVIDPLTELGASSTPIAYVRGNHETWGMHARNITDYVGGHPHKFYYSMSYGPLYVIVLDSGEARQDDDPANAGMVDFDNYRAMQGEWLKEEVKKPAFQQANYRVVLTHIPPFYAARPIHAAAHAFSVWGATLNESGIDLMICGHTHQAGIHPAVPGKHEFPIVIGGGPKDGKRTIIGVKVNRQSLHLTMTHESGDTVGDLNL